jgi:hypothetical protein
MRAAIQERLSFNHAAPLDTAAAHRRSLARIKLRPHRRMNAIAANQHVAAFWWKTPSTFSFDEMRGHPRIVLLERDEVVTGQNVVRTDFRLDLIKQDFLQVTPFDGVLRPCIAGGASARLRPDELTELVVIAKFGGLDSGFG